MRPNENTPLVGGRNNGGDLPLHRPVSFPQRVLHPEQADAPPNVVSSFYWLLTSSYLNALLVFVPFGFLAEHLHWSAAARFGLNFFAIVPLAKLLGDATEQVALKLGQTLGGLLNATFGNAVELIVGIVALTQGQLRIVQQSLIGSILSNILLVLGMTFVAGGFNKAESTFQQTAAQASGSVMTLGCITVVLPAAYRGSLQVGALLNGGVEALKKHSEDPHTEAGLLLISRGASIIMMLVYASYLVFQLRTHAFLFEALPNEDGEDDDQEEAKMSPTSAVLGLLVVTVVTSFNADYLVAAIDEFADQYHIPKPFIGTILLPIVGNAAEHVTSVWMAYKGMMDLALAVSVGSAIQIAVGVLPALVLVGWATGHDLTLSFTAFETTTLVASVVLVNLLIADGKSSWIEGLQLVALYVVAALCFWAQG